MTEFTLLPDSELSEIRQRLIESNGDPSILGENYLQIMRNVIYTCRMKANPMQDNPSDSPAKPKKEKTESVKKETLKGNAVDDFFG